MFTNLGAILGIGVPNADTGNSSVTSMYCISSNEGQNEDNGSFCSSDFDCRSCRCRNLSMCLCSRIL